MNDQNLYNMYAQSSLVEASPLALIVALYEGAITSIGQAKTALAEGDVWARSRCVTKTVGILAELMCSLDHEKGGEISANLKRLYSYMQQRVLLAHATPSAEPMDEVVSLLKNLLDSWQQLAETNSRSKGDESVACTSPAVYAPQPEIGFAYEGYFMDTPEVGREAVFSF